MRATAPDNRRREREKNDGGLSPDSNSLRQHRYGPYFICMRVLSPRSPTWRTIPTGTQLSSITEKALCQKTTSTCGHTRKYTHTHMFGSSVKQMIAFHTCSTGLSKQLISECAQLGAPAALLWTSAPWYEAADPKGHTHSLPYVITHGTTMRACVDSEAAGTPCVSIKMVVHQLGSRL